MSALDRWTGWLVGLLYPLPPLCLICRDQRVTWLSEPLCPECLETLPRLPEPLCEHCGQPLPCREAEVPKLRAGGQLARLAARIFGGPVQCDRCGQDPPPFRRARAVALYSGWVRAAVHRLKYHGEAELALPLGTLMGLLAREELLFLTVSVVIPVPLHPERLAARGYNQSELLARPVAQAIGRPLVPHALERRRPTLPQVGLDEAGRRRNLENAFHVADPKSVKGRRILVVDDVLTTGATCREVARALLEAGARCVDVLTLAVTPRSAGAGAWLGKFRGETPSGT
ncbi:MAG TPA: ComF family protein [Limnochorda sp.]